MRYCDLWRRHANRLHDPQRQTDVRLLIQKAFVLSQEEFWLRQGEEAGDRAAYRRFHNDYRRLLKDEPLAYIMGEKEFFGESFLVDRRVLIPRPATEILVETAVRRLAETLPPAKEPHVLDIGAGCGAVAIMVAIRSNARVTALERERGALAVLKKNIARHGLQDRVLPRAGDLFPRRREVFDLIVSNPPYLSRLDWEGLPVHIKKHEPQPALLAGKTGLEVIARIVERAPGYLRPGGSLLLEIGAGQKRAIAGLLKRARFVDIAFLPDLAGIPRVAAGRRFPLGGHNGQ